MFFIRRRYRLWKWALLLNFGIVCLSQRAIFSVTITQYHPTFNAYIRNGHCLFLTRWFEKDGTPYGLVVDDHTFDVSEVRYASLANLKTASKAQVNTSRFIEKSRSFLGKHHPLANDGIVSMNVPGVVLTIDLCPSPKPFDRDIFESFSGLKYPVPIAISVSGKWIRHHPDDLAWINHHIATNRVEVTWVNHSDSHFYDPKLPLERNFMLANPDQFESEIIKNEIEMLKNGLVPSVFFRFPGLISSPDFIDHLIRLHLLPLGANAWLAKGEYPVTGSIILIHGNGNERRGIECLHSWLQSGQAMPLCRIDPN